MEREKGRAFKPNSRALILKHLKSSFFPAHGQSFFEGCISICMGGELRHVGFGLVWLFSFHTQPVPLRFLAKLRGTSFS
jgi:hypothetical protein